MSPRTRPEAPKMLATSGVQTQLPHSLAIKISHIRRLIQEAATFDKALRPLESTGSLLDKFYIPTRYPNGLPGGIPSDAYNEQEARQAMEWARSIIQGIAGRLG